MLVSADTNYKTIIMNITKLRINSTVSFIIDTNIL